MEPAAAASHPLVGRRIVVTRPAAQASRLIDQLRAGGARPIACPAIATIEPENWEPLDAALAGLDRYRWVLYSSANAVDSVAGRLALLRASGGGGDASVAAIAAVGRATRDAVAAQGWHCDFVPSRADGDSLARELPFAVGDRVLWPRADIARSGPVERLRARGAVVDVVEAYRTVTDPALREVVNALQGHQVDALTFASPSAVRNFMSALKDAGVRPEWLTEQGPVVASIGPVTSAAVRDVGLTVHAESTSADDEGVVKALIRWFSEHAVPFWR
jgi:uroporphyrinogen III methyltransferase/synthase